MKAYSTENIKVKIERFIDSALKKEMSWDNLASVIDKMTPNLDKSKEVIKILLDMIHDKEDQIDDNLETKESNHKVNEVIEYSNIEESEEFMDRSIEVNKDSYNNSEINSQEDKVLLESTVDISTDIQIVENLEDQLFVLFEDDPNKELEMKSGKETNLKPCKELLNSDLEGKEKQLGSKTVEVEKKFQCEICQKLFRKKHKLTEHKKFHPDEKKFQCPSCGKCFVQSCDLRRHERTHTGEKPFQCKTCKKSFAQSYSLNEHRNIHTGEKHFQCNVCSKSFGTKNYLRVHKKIHTGERPFKCQNCNKGFIQSNDLKKHKRTHTDENQKRKRNL